MNQITVPKLKGLCPGYLPLGGGIVIIGADTGNGKSLLGYRIIASATTLTPLIPGVLPTLDAPQKALVFNGEDSAEDYAKPRLVAAGTNMKRVKVFDCVVKHAKWKLSDIPAEVEKHDATFVQIDPLQAFDNPSISAYAVRQRLAPFHKLVHERGITFIICHHTRKA